MAVQSLPAAADRFLVDGAFGFWEIAASQPHRVAVVASDGTETSFGDLRQQVDRLSHLLRRLGVGEADAVALLLPNTPDWLACSLATSQIGAYLVPLNWHLTASELGYLLTNSGSKVLIAGGENAAAAATAADLAALDPQARLSFGAVAGFREVAPLLALMPATPPDDRKAGSSMFYSSGTTGQPKGIRKKLPGCRPEVALARTVPLYSDMYGLKAGAFTHLVVTPLYHAAPGSRAVQLLHLGHRVVLMQKWDAEQMLTLVERHRVNSVQVVPILFNRLLQLPAEVRARYDVSSLDTVIHAAAPCPVETKQRMIDWFGPIIHEYYAASEGGGTHVTASDWLSHPGTVGRAYPFSRIRILDEHGTQLPPGEPGLVYMNDGTEFEYHGEPHKTSQAKRDGFFTAGDYGYLDKDGWLFICDRRADLILSGGVNIYPAEVEAALMSHPDVTDVGVIGIPDPEWGQSVLAIVESATGRPPDELEAALREHCVTRLASFKRPRVFHFAKIPRTDAGKVSRLALKQAYEQGLIAS